MRLRDNGGRHSPVVPGIVPGFTVLTTATPSTSARKALFSFGDSPREIWGLF
nr:MAG TPA: hypothetical protein [Caudoviricetes sp.]